MMFLKSRNDRRRQGRKFVPSLPGGQAGARLEARALTAPAFWRQPGSWTGALDTSTDFAMAQTNGAVDHPSDVPAGDGEYSAMASSLSENTSATGLTTLTISALATSQAIDLGQTFPPDAPIGAQNIQANTTNSITVTSSGAGEPVFNFMNSSAFTQRFYVLADETFPVATSIMEHASIHYAAGSASVNAMWGNVASFNGLNVTAAGDNTGITGVTINGTTVPLPSSGSFTDGAGNAISYTASASGVEAFSLTALGTLPPVSRDFFGNVQGVSWPVSTGSTLATPIGLLVDGGMSSVATHYDAHFV